MSSEYGKGEETFDQAWQKAVDPWLKKLAAGQITGDEVKPLLESLKTLNKKGLRAALDYKHQGQTFAQILKGSGNLIAQGAVQKLQKAAKLPPPVPPRAATTQLNANPPKIASQPFQQPQDGDEALSPEQQNKLTELLVAGLAKKLEEEKAAQLGVGDKKDRQRTTSVSSLASGVSVKELAAQLDQFMTNNNGGVSEASQRQTREAPPLPPVTISSVAHCKEYLKDWVAIKGAMNENKINSLPLRFRELRSKLEEWLKGEGKEHLQEVANLKCKDITIDQTGVESVICSDIKSARQNDQLQDIKLDKKEVRPIITHQIAQEAEAEGKAKALAAAQKKEEEERVKGLINKVSQASIDDKTKKLDMQKFKDAVNGILGDDLEKVAKAVSEKAETTGKEKLYGKLLNANKPKKGMMQILFGSFRGLN